MFEHTIAINPMNISLPQLWKQFEEFQNEKTVLVALLITGKELNGSNKDSFLGS